MIQQPRDRRQSHTLDWVNSCLIKWSPAGNPFSGSVIEWLDVVLHTNPKRADSDFIFNTQNTFYENNMLFYEKNAFFFLDPNKNHQNKYWRNRNKANHIVTKRLQRKEARNSLPIRLTLCNLKNGILQVAQSILNNVAAGARGLTLIKILWIILNALLFQFT